MGACPLLSLTVSPEFHPRSSPYSHIESVAVSKESNDVKSFYSIKPNYIRKALHINSQRGKYLWK
jgi:hypothetical protein